ncbi:hypothetical protein ODZ84_18030 [Chryseobacterium fluminis]|uniref:hypothetical protein n=1 Tax=Chryseobacterium fluminis TaxID=2983606 RepID=UPI00225AB9E0|nr:hypothetical protein [Chryseobacterium sp. MMS21-Ot14]UZT97081.1 hypothetical protein ODZ84_18030 [Chryseobacterium sp. MMS21-Ot14]
MDGYLYQPVILNTTVQQSFKTLYVERLYEQSISLRFRQQISCFYGGRHDDNG